MERVPGEGARRGSGVALQDGSRPEHVEQYVPFHDIRRLSVWGEEEYIQL